MSKEIWGNKYRWKEGDHFFDTSIEDTWKRLATSIAKTEQNPHHWEEKFLSILVEFKFLPGGRIIANSGTTNRATLLNCFVMGTIEDSLEGIFQSLKEGALTMQLGGGVGYDFSTLRPRDTITKTTGRIASGPVSFMHIWNTMCATILTTGARRGAMMATLRCDHPDILEFIKAKNKPGDLNYFNLSVLITDEFMRSVRDNQPWELVFPEEHLGVRELSLKQTSAKWPGYKDATAVRVLKTLPARDLWHELLLSAYQSSEPGVLFIDHINKANNLWYTEYITATNPCGEIPLPPYGACDLGSINLTQFVKNPFTLNPVFLWDQLEEIVPICIRFLDNVIEISDYPQEEQRNIVKQTRRLGLGITGLADVLVMMNLNYNSSEGRDFSQRIMKSICYQGYLASIELAKERGPFPTYNRDQYQQGEFIKSLPEDIKHAIFTYGIRNSHILAIAPTGTISILANNISSGIEPIFSIEHKRRILQKNGEFIEYNVTDYAAALWKKIHNDQPISTHFMSAHEVDPKDHVLMQAALQPYVDNSISKTINVSNQIAFDRFSNIYDLAYDLNLKGCTVFRQTHPFNSILQ